MTELNPTLIWKRYGKGRQFNDSLDLDAEVKTNEDFFIGKQWEGVKSAGLPTPVFNFLKRVTLHTIASITNDNIKLTARSLGASNCAPDTDRVSDIFNRELESVFEAQSLGSKLR